MKIEQYIVVKGKKKSTYSKPNLDADEVAVKVVLELPEALFDKPTLQANIEVPEEAVTKPVIEAEVIDNIEEIIKQNTGFEVRLGVVSNEQES